MALTREEQMLEIDARAKKDKNRWLLIMLIIMVAIIGVAVALIAIIGLQAMVAGIIGGVIGGFVLVWRLLVAAWYVPLTAYRLIVA